MRFIVFAAHTAGRDTACDDRVDAARLSIIVPALKDVTGITTANAARIGYAAIIHGRSPPDWNIHTLDERIHFGLAK